MTDSKSRKRPGPKADRLKIDASFEDAAAQVFKAKKPAGGWDTPRARSKAKKKK